MTGLGTLRTRLQRAAARGYTKFVGRQREMDMMKRAAESAKAGHGQIVAVVAEPGVGKSCLFHEFKAGPSPRCGAKPSSSNSTNWARERCRPWLTIQGARRASGFKLEYGLRTPAKRRPRCRQRGIHLLSGFINQGARRSINN